MSDDFDDDREYVEEQARNMRDVRLRREADDRRWREVRDTERARPIEQREHFLFAEAAERLARDPKNLTIDPELRERVIRDLFAWVENRQFTAEEVAIINVVWGGIEPFELAPDATLASGAEEVLFLTRKALRRYVKARIELAGAVSLLRDWFGAGAPESNTTAADALRVGAFMSGPKGDETSVADPTWDIAPGALLEDTERQPEPGYGRLGGSENPAGDGFRQIIKDQTGNWPKTPRAFVEAYIVRNKGNPRNLSANKCFKKWKNVGNTGYREVIREEFRNQMHDRGLEVTKGAPRKPVPE